MTSVAFTQLFNAVVAGTEGTELQKAVINSYKRMLRSEPDSHSEDKNVTLFKDAAAAVKNATARARTSDSHAVVRSAVSQGVSSSVVVSTSRTISFFLHVLNFPLSVTVSLCVPSLQAEKKVGTTLAMSDSGSKQPGHLQVCTVSCFKSGGKEVEAPSLSLSLSPL
jgi:hypothetical protein